MTEPLHYFDPEPPDRAPEACGYALLPLAYDATACYVRGAARAPEAIRVASYQLELLDEEVGFAPWEAGIATLRGPELAALAPEAMVEAVERAADSASVEGRHLIGIGGEHSVSVGLIRAALRRGPFDVLHIDAHSDLRPEYEGSRFSHACVAARAREMGPRVVQVGVRSSCREESEALEDAGVRTFWMRDLRRRPSAEWIDDVVGALGARVYVTFDFDAFDSGFMPSVGTPEPGGLDWFSVVDLLEAVACRRHAVGSDFVELCPLAGFHAPDFAAARLIYRWIGFLEAARREAGA